MKLEKKIVIQPPPFSTNAGQVVNPDPLEFEELDLTFQDTPKAKVIQVFIKDIPNPINLYTAQAYDDLGDWTKEQLEARLKESLGPHPDVFLRSTFPRTMEEDPHGPGTQLSKMIKTLGIHMSDSCSCRRHALKMNEMGGDWCLDNIDTVVGWLEEEAKRRGLPFVKMVGKVMVNRAVKKSKKLIANEPVPENDEDLDKEE